MAVVDMNPVPDSTPYGRDLQMRLLQVLDQS